MSHALDRVCEALRRRGYRVAFPPDRGEPAAIATPGPESTPSVADGELALEPLDAAHTTAFDAARPADPTTVVDRVADAAPDRTCLFVVDPGTAAEVRDVLTDPPAVRAVDEDGCRTFYSVPDRLSTGDGLACVRADGAPTWREEPATGGLSGEAGGGSASPADGGGRIEGGRAAGEDDRRLVLEADGEVHAAFEDHAALACPAPGAFPYSYRRGEDRRVHVRNPDGREVGVYPSVRGMKADAYRPVPDPLVPETHLPDGVRLRRAWALAVVDNGVQFERG